MADKIHKYIPLQINSSHAICLHFLIFSIIIIPKYIEYVFSVSVFSLSFSKRNKELFQDKKIGAPFFLVRPQIFQLLTNCGISSPVGF